MIDHYFNALYLYLKGTSNITDVEVQEEEEPSGSTQACIHTGV
jgi:hypothetical protein